LADTGYTEKSRPRNKKINVCEIVVVQQGDKLKISDKENNQWKLNINLDKKRYIEFFEKVTKLAKDLEYKSEVKKLNYSIVLNAVKIPDMATGGWSNRCEDFKFVLFLDFDNSLWWQVKTQLELLIEKFNLPPMYVFETESHTDCNKEEYGNYNVFCPIKLRFFETFEIQNETTCDIAHKNLPKIYRFKSAILRNKPKGKKGAPIFKCVIGDINKEYNQPVSSVHLNFIKRVYPNIPYIKYINEDRLNKLWLSDYKTASK